MASSFVDAIRIEPGHAAKLAERDPGARPDLVGAEIRVDAFDQLDARFPTADPKLDGLKVT